MTVRQNSAMILVIVKQVDDVELARALVEAIGGDFAFYLLFSQEELRDRFGVPGCQHGVDSQLCVLNPQHFGLVISFWGERDPNPSSNVLLLSFFNEVGVPTLEIQHALFQEGIIDPVDGEHVSKPLSAALRRGYAAQGYLSWDGPDGVGYLKSELVRNRHAVQREDLILISSQLEAPRYGDKERYQFAIAVLKLATQHPELEFVWPLRPSELAHSETKLVLSMVEEHGLPNLILDKSEGMEVWAPRCRVGISTPSTALLEYELRRKPVLVYLSAAPAVVTTSCAAHGFSNYFELERAFRRACDAPADFLVDTGVGRLNRERLREKLGQAMRAQELEGDWLPTALRYVAYMREGRTARVEIGKVAGAVAGLDVKLTSFEAQFSALQKSVAELDLALGGVAKELPGLRSRLAGIADRVGLLQRSTLGYRARRFMARWSGKGDREAPPH